MEEETNKSELCEIPNEVFLFTDGYEEVLFDRNTYQTFYFTSLSQIEAAAHYYFHEEEYRGKVSHIDTNWESKCVWVYGWDAWSDPQKDEVELLATWRIKTLKPFNS